MNRSCVLTCRTDLSKEKVRDTHIFYQVPQDHRGTVKTGSNLHLPLSKSTLEPRPSAFSKMSNAPFLRPPLDFIFFFFFRIESSKSRDTVETVSQ